MFARATHFNRSKGSMIVRRRLPRAVRAACEALEGRFMLSLAAPSGLVGARFSHFQAQLMWTDNSSNEDGFTIERRTTPNGSPTIISRPANTTTYTDPFLNAETTYYYQVKARKSGEPDSA